MLEEQDDELLEDADCQEELARPAWQKKFFQGQNRPAEKEMSEYQKRLLGRLRRVRIIDCWTCAHAVR